MDYQHTPHDFFFFEVTVSIKIEYSKEKYHQPNRKLGKVCDQTVHRKKNLAKRTASTKLKDGAVLGIFKKQKGDWCG